MPLINIEKELMDLVTSDENIHKINELIAKSVNVNCIDDLGYSPLITATEFNQVDVVRLLIEHGANVNFFSNNKKSVNQTPLMVAAIEGYYDIAEILLDNNADPDLSPKNNDGPIIQAALNKNFQVVRLLANRGADVNVVTLITTINIADGNPTLDTPLHYAAEAGDAETVEYLLKHEADPDLQEAFGYTPLHLACVESHINTARVLLCGGAEINVEDNDGQTPLHHACAKGDIQMVHLLLSFGADVSVRDSEGKTPLFKAFDSGATEIFELLVHANTDLNIKSDDEEGWTVLHVVVANGDQYLDMLEILLQQPQRIKINGTDNKNRTPLDIAKEYGRRFNSHTKTIDYLERYIKELLNQPLAKSAGAIISPMKLLHIGSPNKLTTVMNLPKDRRKIVPIRKNQTPALERNVNVLPDQDLITQIINSANLISEHASRRIDLCFYTLIFYYQKKCNITLGHTILQHGQGKGAGGTFTQACHSAFISNPVEFLNCYTIDGRSLFLHTEWNQNNQFFNNLNMTVELPRAVNNFDSDLEGKIGSPSKWRLEFLKVLNQVSFGIKDPVEGLKSLYEIMHIFFTEKRREYFSGTDRPKKLIYAFEFSGTFLGWDDTHKIVKQSYINSILQINNPAEHRLITQANDLRRQVNNLYENRCKQIAQQIKPQDNPAQQTHTNPAAKQVITVGQVTGSPLHQNTSPTPVINNKPVPDMKPTDILKFK